MTITITKLLSVIVISYRVCCANEHLSYKKKTKNFSQKWLGFCKQGTSFVFRIPIMEGESNCNSERQQSKDQEILEKNPSRHDGELEPTKEVTCYDEVEE